MPRIKPPQLSDSTKPTYASQAKVCMAPTMLPIHLPVTFPANHSHSSDLSVMAFASQRIISQRIGQVLPLLPSLPVDCFGIQPTPGLTPHARLPSIGYRSWPALFGLLGPCPPCARLYRLRLATVNTIPHGFFGCIATQSEIPTKTKEKIISKIWMYCIIRIDELDSIADTTCMTLTDSDENNSNGRR